MENGNPVSMAHLKSGFYHSCFSWIRRYIWNPLTFLELQKTETGSCFGGGKWFLKHRQYREIESGNPVSTVKREKVKEMHLRGFQDFTECPISKLLPAFLRDRLELGNELVALQYALSLGLDPAKTRDTDPQVPNISQLCISVQLYLERKATISFRWAVRVSSRRSRKLWDRLRSCSAMSGVLLKPQNCEEDNERKMLSEDENSGYPKQPMIIGVG